MAYNVTKSKKPRTIAEEDIKSCVLYMVKIVLWEEASKKFELVQFSNNVILCRISYLSSNILHQVIADIKASSMKIFFQLDEKTDVENCSQLIALVRYIHDSTIIEYFIFEDLKRTTKAKIIFQCLKNFLRTRPRYPSYCFCVY